MGQKPWRRLLDAASTPLWSARIRKAEWAAFVAACLVVLVLHAVLYAHMGAFWRDETSSIQVARTPTLATMWDWLNVDSFPVLFVATLRTWIFAGLGGTDSGIRLFGTLVALGMVGAVLFCCRALRQSAPSDGESMSVAFRSAKGRGFRGAKGDNAPAVLATVKGQETAPASATPTAMRGVPALRAPLVALTLMAFNPSVFYFGSSIRAYGLATLLILLCLGAFWRLIERPGKRTAAVALAMALLSTHSNYQNTYLLLGIGVAGAVCCAACGLWQRCLVVLGPCVLTALSMLIYVPVVRSYQATTGIGTGAYTAGIGLVGTRMLQAIGGESGVLLGVWGTLAVLTTVLLPLRCLRHWQSAERSAPSLDLFCLVSVVVAGTAGTFFFLFNGNMPWPWHYVPVIGFAAVIMEAALRPTGAWRWLAPCRSLLAGIAVAFSVVPLWNAAHVRRTNMDLVCDALAGRTGAGDLIVVNPFWFSPAFHYYYRGGAEWVTLPAIPSDEKSRVGAFGPYRRLMATPNALNPTLQRIEETLKSGKRIWIAGYIFAPAPGEPPPVVSPATAAEHGGDCEVYYRDWTLQIGYFLGQARVQLEQVYVPLAQPVFPLEAVPLLLVERRPGVEVPRWP
jgi:hypothetical protein